MALFSSKKDEALVIPEHIAIVMDGNGRWAKKRMMPRQAGHAMGRKAVRRVLNAAIDLGVKHLTLFAFSSENWSRPADEVGALMDLFKTVLISEVEELSQNGIRLTFIGDTSAFSAELQALMQDAVSATQNGEAFQLNIAVNYGGRWQLAHAARMLAEAVQEGQLQTQDIDETILGDAMLLNGSPDPELFIRTGGESRISNFLLWQLAYSELYFCETLWPDFNKKSLRDAIAWFSTRERRFGKTSEQVEEGA